jgi:hypothetical protein
MYQSHPTITIDGVHGLRSTIQSGLCPWTLVTFVNFRRREKVVIPVDIQCSGTCHLLLRVACAALVKTMRTSCVHPRNESTTHIYELREKDKVLYDLNFGVTRRS